MFGIKKNNKYTKTLAKHHRKIQGKNKTTKQKFAPEYGFQKASLRTKSFLLSIFGSEKPNKCSKTWAKHHRKTLERNKTTKTKARARKWISKTEPKKKNHTKTSKRHRQTHQTQQKTTHNTSSSSGMTARRVGGAGPLISIDSWSSLILAHRNRSDFCDLRLLCPSRTPEIAAISETGESNAALRSKGAMESR